MTVIEGCVRFGGFLEEERSLRSLSRSWHHRQYFLIDWVRLFVILFYLNECIKYQLRSVRLTCSSGLACSSCLNVKSAASDSRHRIDYGNRCHRLLPVYIPHQRQALSRNVIIRQRRPATSCFFKKRCRVWELSFGRTFAIFQASLTLYSFAERLLYFVTEIFGTDEIGRNCGLN